MTDDDLQELQNAILKEVSSTPLGSECYKIRVSPTRMNKGKNTSLRIVYIEYIVCSKVYLVCAFSKSDEANITRKELADIRDMARFIKENEL